MKQPHVFPSLISAGLLALLSQSASATNLIDIYELARSNDSDFRAAEYQHNSSLEALPQSKASRLPQINLGANISTNHLDAAGNTSDYQNNSLTLSLNQSIYHREQGVQIEQAEAAISQSDAEFEAAQQGLILRVAESYFNVLAAIDNLEFARTERTAIARQLEQAQKRFEVGLIAITDVKEAQARHDLAVSQEIAAKTQLTTSREALRVITKDEQATLQALQEQTPLISPDPENMEEWVATAEAQNRQYMALRHANQSAMKGIELSRSGHYPTVDLIASYNRQDNGGGFLTGVRETTSLQLQLNVPLYSGGATTSRVKQAQAVYDANREQLEKVRRTTAQQARNAYLGVVAAISQVQALKQALVSTQTAAEATQAGFDVGTRTAVEVLLALQETYRAQRDYQSARYSYILNTLRLKQAAGTLSLDDLQKINGWLK